MNKLNAQTLHPSISPCINTPIDTAINTPWGRADHSTTREEGITRHSTPSHGGFHLDAPRNFKVHPSWRNNGGWYEEDVEWAKVAFTFPALFTADERASADRFLRDFHPNAYEHITGITLLKGQSYKCDQARFAHDHKADWVVIAALMSDHHHDLVECIATLGGLRGKGDERRFLVPKFEYRVRRHSFVIDLDRHAAYDGPSSFVGWRER
ncbi:MAG: hypothetical protein KGQ46_13770 [Hyphomicrobiales bacterium]|nr:hypothetical protein [Hyphomicrobiales bacterium]MDE2115068.1 hypothetical protein [Hyphomicrobiales bacterium]